MDSRTPLAAEAPATVAAAAIPVGWPDMLPHRSFLIAFARRRLHDTTLAEDLVHDVFEAVATGRAVFGGRSALKSWLVAVLKHKIVDLVRERSGCDSLDAGFDSADEDGSPEPAFELACPQPRPDEVAEQRQRLRQTLRRIAELPDTLKRAVELRLLQDKSSADVCRALSISEDNLFVRLHRARRVLVA
jgi:RNA polymerase sigma-70 factor, ECF subfamily